jgi:hypothetical protein
LSHELIIAALTTFALGGHLLYEFALITFALGGHLLFELGEPLPKAFLQFIVR